MADINDNLNKIREVFLADDVDEEDRKDNEERINAWSKALTENKSMVEWQKQDITQLIIRQAKESYKESAMQLIRNRTLTPEQRASIYAKQDAMLWLLSLIETDAEKSLEQVQKEIQRAVDVT